MAASGVEIRHPFLGVNVVPAGTPVLMASGHPVGNGTIVERGVERLVRVRGFVRASTSAASLYPHLRPCLHCGTRVVPDDLKSIAQTIAIGV